MKPRRGALLAGLAFSILLLDQALKHVLARSLDSDGVTVTSFLRIAMMHNTGAGFSILQGQNALLAWLAVMAIGAILLFHDRISTGRETVAVGLLLGGIAGNLVDRLSTDAVIDFIDFSFFPAFNVADSALVIGAALLCLALIRKKDGAYQATGKNASRGEEKKRKE